MQTKICGDPQTSTPLGSALDDDDLHARMHASFRKCECIFWWKVVICFNYSHVLRYITLLSITALLVWQLVMA